MADEVVLHDYWRSSAAYRVRIALNLKGVAYRAVEVDLVAGDQRGDDYRALNPLGLIPLLEIDGHRISQSLAIIDYLDARFPEPRLLPADPAVRALTWARALTIAAEVHPLQNLRVQQYLRHEMGQDKAAIDGWLQRWLGDGLAALEASAPESGLLGGSAPDLADVCLVPQMFSARRFGVPVDAYPRLVRIDAELNALPAVAAAAPDRVKPA
ncbi:maleylacetoacetate isomerase [Novosphingobium arvoryzae]|uniref:Maleylacetoacetate isomerase n=1 Tax=Novosphingobium arvoryzae TaxID=1256514 RepID=A0A918VI32_9SPHN|nr:maleylacetoacetate isomerase [Novosphingobium arvoryzae]GGZ98472.1 maleylacetoacetate isomerase [Novosphingobium arvoryzae]